MFGTIAAGEQAIVADAVAARRQHMHQETADELVGGKRHHLVARGTFDPVVLSLEGGPFVIAGDETAVRDGDAVGVAREIEQHLLGPAEEAEQRSLLMTGILPRPCGASNPGGNGYVRIGKLQRDAEGAAGRIDLQILGDDLGDMGASDILVDDNGCMSP